MGINALNAKRMARNKDFFYYGCKHRNMQRGHNVIIKSRYERNFLDDAVAEVIVKLVSNPNFATMCRKNQYES